MIEKKAKMQVLIHLLAWIIFFGFPLLFMVESGEHEYVRYWIYIVNTAIYIAVFYLNYNWLIQRYLFTKQINRFIWVNLLMIALLSVMFFYLKEFEIHRFMPQQPPLQLRVLFYFRDISFILLMVGLSVAVKMTGNWYRVEAIHKETERAQFEAELKNLKSQLNPHFLFNTLNNIYSLVIVKPEKAQEAIHRLSNLLRYALYENNANFVPLDKELKFIESYIELMSLRLSRNVQLSTQIKGGNPVDQIAPMLFISIIENAFKHGVSPTEASFINIDIEAKSGKGLVCKVENSNFPKKEMDRSGSGIGHENLLKRLDLLYPGKYKLTAENRGECYFVELIITF